MRSAQSLTTWVITNALDDEGSGALIADTVSAYHKELGGVTKDPTKSNDDKKNKNANQGAQAPGGLMIEPPADGHRGGHPGAARCDRPVQAQPGDRLRWRRPDGRGHRALG